VLIKQVIIALLCVWVPTMQVQIMGDWYHKEWNSHKNVAWCRVLRKPAISTLACLAAKNSTMLEHPTLGHSGAATPSHFIISWYACRHAGKTGQ